MYIVNLFLHHIILTLLCFYWKILQQIETLHQCPKCSFHQRWKCVHHFVILTFSIVAFVNTITCSFALFILVTIDVIYVNSVRFKHIDSSCNFLELTYRGHNFNFLKLKQLFKDDDIESNPGPIQNDCKSAVGHPKKVKVFKGTAKKSDFGKNNVNIASDSKVQKGFLNTIESVSLDIIKPWSVTCPSTLESLQKLEFEVNNDINSKVSLSQGDITELNVDVNSVNKTLIGGEGAIHKAAGPGLLDECQKLSNCEIGECKVT